MCILIVFGVVLWIRQQNMSDEYECKWREWALDVMSMCAPQLALAAELSGMREGLAEERFRYERLEEQVNDLTELHQNEMGNLLTNMADMEEKVQYQSEERIRDLHEIVENCHTRVSVSGP